MNNEEGVAAARPFLATRSHRGVQIVGMAGRGSHANVYRGVTRGGSGVAREVAVKVFLKVDAELHPRAVARLAAVAAKAAGVRSPAVVATYEFGVFDGRPLLVTELVEGGTLAKFATACERAWGRVPVDVALLLAVAIAEGLEAAAQTMVHGHLGARDVLVSVDGEVKVSDFGIATALGGRTPLPSSRARATTVAPEVARGEAPTERSDVFSLGAILREMVIGTGVLPPPRISAILRRALEADPASRHASAREFGADLRRAAAAMGMPIYDRDPLGRLRHHWADLIASRCNRAASVTPASDATRSR
jgi:serine/threonine-protein kinase